MPRPEQPFEMIHFGDKRTLANVIGPNYFDTVGAARLFFPNGYGDVVEFLEIGQKKTLVNYCKDSIAACKDDWRSFCDSEHWNRMGASQIAAATKGLPMSLPKIFLAVRALEIAAEEISRIRKKPPIDIYNAIRIIPAIYRVDGLNKNTLLTLLHEHTDAVRKFNEAANGYLVPSRVRAGSNDLLNDMAGPAPHVTKEIGQAAVDILSVPGTLDLALVPAKKNGKANLAPASDALIFPLIGRIA